MRNAKYLAVLLSVLLVSSARGQEMAKPLGNQDVVEMVGLGLSEDVIVAKIRSMNGTGSLKFDTSLDGLKALKAANVPDGVIKVMINPAPPPPTVVAATAPMTMDPNLPPPEVGVYWKDGSNFVFIDGFTLTQAKVGGRAGSIFTSGIRGEHWDATVAGPTSNNIVKDRRPQFYLYVPDGNSASDYSLITLNKKSDHREFQIGSIGGVSGGKSGVKKDKEVAFKSEHVGIRMYKISLDEDLKPGEYAFFMGTGAESNMTSGAGSPGTGGSASGRVYDFSVPQ
jgi:hypothetical protein